MDSSGSVHGSVEEHIEQPAVNSSSLTTMAISITQPEKNGVTIDSSDSILQKTDGASNQTTAEELSHICLNTAGHPSAGTDSHSSDISGQPETSSGHCSHQPATYVSCPSATHPRAVEEGSICVCPTLDRLLQSPASTATDPAADLSTSLQLESERPGPSGVPSARPVPRPAAVDGTPRGRPPLPPGRSAVGEHTLCCAAATAQPCHVLSLPDMRRSSRADTGETAGAVGTPERVCPAAAAASSDPTTGQPPSSAAAAVRPSASSGIRVALQSVASHTSFISPLSSIGPFCRICHEGESRELLISPCRCAGSVGLVHVSCIEKWLSAANKDSCEICMYKYVTERRPKPLLEWLLNPSNPEDARNLVGDIICFFLLTALAVIAAYLCLMGASHYLSYKTQWEATGLVVLGLLISSIYCVWLVVTCRYHCRVWQDWRRTHQDVHLLEMKRLSHSTVDLNNNAVSAPPPPPVGAGCRACRGGSYACSHCCSVCPIHGVQLELHPVTAPAVGGGGGGADDVFDDGLAADGGCEGGTSAGGGCEGGTSAAVSGAICGSAAAPIGQTEGPEK